MKEYIIPQTHMESVSSMALLTSSAPAQAFIPIHTGERLYEGEY